MFYLIGLGLGDAKDITVKGLEIVKQCDKVLLEGYTSILTVGKDILENFYGRPLILADREICESSIDDILQEAKDKDIALLVVGDPLGATTHTDMLLRAKELGFHTQNFYGRPLILADREICESSIDDILQEAKDKDIALLVVGDPLGATTHTDMLLRAKELGVKTQIVHNASIMNAVSCCGLQLYNFGETVSIPYWTETWKPDSFFKKIIDNYSRNLHTLCLLDIKVKEPTEESLTKKVRQYMDPKFMSVKEAASQLIEIINNNECNAGLTASSLAVGLSRVGAPDQNIAAKTLEEMKDFDLGPPLHSLVIPAPSLHPIEVDFLEQFR